MYAGNSISLSQSRHVQMEFNNPINSIKVICLKENVNTQNYAQDIAEIKEKQALDFKTEKNKKISEFELKVKDRAKIFTRENKERKEAEENKKNAVKFRALNVSKEYSMRSLSLIKKNQTKNKPEPVEEKENILENLSPDNKAEIVYLDKKEEESENEENYFSIEEVLEKYQGLRSRIRKNKLTFS